MHIFSFRYSLLSLISVSLVFLAILMLVSGFNGKKYVKCLWHSFSVSGCLANPDKAIFVAKCVRNGRENITCACTYMALNDRHFPKDYREITEAWANQSDERYYRALVSHVGWNLASELVGVENLKHILHKNIRKFSYKRKASRILNSVKPDALKNTLKYLRREGVGFRKTKFLRNVKLLKRLGVIVTVVRTGSVLLEVAEYKIVTDRHCSGETKDLYPLLVKAKEIKNKTIKNTKDAIESSKEIVNSTGNTIKNSAMTSWSFVKMLIWGDKQASRAQ